MKLILALSAVAGLAAWQAHSWLSNPSDPEPPAASATVAQATPAAPDFAPEGVYYLTERQSFTTDAGISGIDAGTEVRLVRDRGLRWVMTDGHREFEVRRDQLTNDRNVVHALVARDKNVARVIASNIRKDEELKQKTEEKVSALTQQYERQTLAVRQDTFEQEARTVEAHRLGIDERSVQPEKPWQYQARSATGEKLGPDKDPKKPEAKPVTEPPKTVVEPPKPVVQPPRPVVQPPRPQAIQVNRPANPPVP